MGNINWIREDTEKVRRAASRGNAEAAYELAQRLLTGRKVDRNPRAAYDECAYAASRGVVAALNLQGYLLATGTGVVADEREAFRCFKRAALRKDAVAWYNLGLCFAEGIGLAKPDQEAADTCLRHSAKLGYAKAQVARARRLFAEARTPEERRTAALWLAQEARKGDRDAMDAALACLRALRRQRAGLPVALSEFPTLQFAAA